MHGLAYKCSIREILIEFFEHLGHYLADELEMEWSPSKGPPAYRVGAMLRKAVFSANSPLLILAIDEVDVLSKHDAGERFESMLRALLSDPRRGKICGVCAGMLPPWLWDNPGIGSPWWNVFLPLRVPPFTLDQIQEFWRRIDPNDKQEIVRLFSLIGGQPWLLMSAARRVTEGIPLSKVIEHSSKIDSPFLPISRMAVDAVRCLLPNYSVILKALISGKEIRSDRDRELLWLAGIIRDADENPPSISASIIEEVIRRFFIEGD